MSEPLRAYLPRLQLERVLRRLRLEERAEQAEVVQGAFLLLDLVGFSATAAALSRRGARGAEDLSETVLPLFAAAADAVHALGGDVLYYAGDAVAAVFPTPPGGSLDRAALRAVEAALEALRRAELLSARSPHPLRMRASLAVGEATAFEAGGYRGQWLLYVHGRALAELERVDRASQPGVLTVSTAAHALVADRVRATPQPDGVIRVESLLRGAEPLPAPDGPEPPELAQVLEPFVAPPVRSRLAAKVAAPILEFRSVTVFFLHIPDLDADGRGDRQLAQRALHLAQRSVVERGGMVLNVIGDKGLGLIALFGAPSMAHEDDAARALDSALECRRALSRLGVSTAIGVASGVVLCAEHAARHRRGFDAVGSTMVLAARLMQRSGRDDLLCCGATRHLAQRAGHQFEALPPTDLKGFDAPVPVARPLGRQATAPRAAPALLGRQREREEIEAALDLLGPGGGGALWLEGEAGIGKSRLLAEVRERARARGLRAVHGAADPVETQTPYFALRGALAGLAGLDGLHEPDDVRAEVLSWVDRAAPQLSDLAPLLDAILPLELTENEHTAPLQGAARAERLADLLVELVRFEAEREPLLLVLEDLHWASQETWGLLRQLLERVSRLLVVATFRPFDPEPTLPGTHGQRLRLGGLDRDATARLLAAALGVDALPPEVTALVHQRSEGNPLFSEELLRALVDAGALRVDEGRVQLQGELSQAQVPASVSGVITARIDRLAPAVQAVLKVASVIGRSFDRPTLAAALPEAALLPQLDGALDTLEHQHFLESEGGGEASWRFRHALIQETAYALLPYAHRKPLHRAIAQFVEARHRADPSSVTALLAHHWTAADEPAPAAHYSGLAGRQALDAYAAEACIAHLERALAFDERARGPQRVDLQRATWCRQIAEAWYSVPRHDEARGWFLRAWQLAGWAPPRFGLRTLVELARHLWLRLSPPAPTTDPELVARCEQATGSAADLGSIYLWGGALHHYLHTTVAADNIGRLVERGHSTAEARATLGYLEVAAGLRGPGFADLQRALEITEQAERGDTAAPHTLTGMAHVVAGRVEESLAHHQRAVEVADRYASGLWRHRSLFMRAEATLMLARYDETVALMRRVVPIARLAEPSSAAHATAIIGLCQLRQGAPPAQVVAAMEGPDGLPLARGASQVLQHFSSLALLAWAHWLDGRHAQALAEAQEAVALAARSGQECFSYLRAIDGHLHLYLLCDEATRLGLPDGRALLPRALGHVRKQARMFPVLAATRGLVDGAEALRTGALRKADRRLRAAVDAAARMGLAWEEAQAASLLARATAPDQRAPWLDRAEALALRLGDRRLADAVQQTRLAQEPR